MAGELSNYAEDGLLDHLLKGTAFPFGAEVRYIGISRADPTDDGSGNNEPTGEGNYARVQVLGTGWNAASGRQITNNGAISFPTLTSAINGATHWTLWDAVTGGNYLGKAAIPGTPDFEIGSTPTIEDATFVIGWSSGGLSNYAANALLEHLTLKTEYSQPSALYAFLSEGNPGDDFAGIQEPVGNGYARALASAAFAAAGWLIGCIPCNLAAKYEAEQHVAQIEYYAEHKQEVDRILKGMIRGTVEQAIQQHRQQKGN